MADVQYQWRFFRAGGFDQVLLETADDLLALDQLDKKLWSALSCPVKGIEFDNRTLELIDSDNDGHIRVPEVLAAIAWTAACLKDTSLLTGKSGGDLPLSAINPDTDEGKRILGASRTILEHLGTLECGRICVEDTIQSEEVLSRSRFNGDGVITPAVSDDPVLSGWITDIMTTVGSEPDRSGDAGINREHVERFAAETDAWLSWNEEAVTARNLIPEAQRDDVLTTWKNIRSKIDDYFLRCSMAAFDIRAETLMNSSDESLNALAPRNLTDAQDEMAALPLAKVSSVPVLPLTQGVNPAWSDTLRMVNKTIITPFIGIRDQLTSSEWNELKQAVQGYEAWWASKPETVVASLGIDRLRQWRSDKPRDAIFNLIDRDLALQPVFESIIEVERLTRYCRDLLSLANNFVSFRDFYGGRGKAVFQAGTLFLDGRSFDLCINVTDVAKHALLANLSRVYLVYCDCVRHGGSDKITIVAGITNGDADQILVGRNGVFYDRKGQDWDATIVRIVEHPISIRQAFWDPYKRIGKTVGEQMQKLAAARSKAAEDKAAINLIQAGQKKDEVKPAPFDAAKFAGIFAAIGLAIGAIGTAIASLITGFLKLAWWQMPLALFGIVLLISGPSIAIAWFKLRQRNLGRLLDANGWAVNTRARINIPFGASLTGLARLPQGALHSMTDPFADKKSPWGRWLLLLLIAAGLAVAWRYGFFTNKH